MFTSVEIVENWQNAIKLTLQLIFTPFQQRFREMASKFIHSCNMQNRRRFTETTEVNVEKYFNAVLLSDLYVLFIHR